MRREALIKLEELRRLENGNQKIQAEKYELQIESLDNKLREAEALRKELQFKLEFTSS